MEINQKEKQKIIIDGVGGIIICKNSKDAAININRNDDSIKVEIINFTICGGDDAKNKIEFLMAQLGFSKLACNTIQFILKFFKNPKNKTQF